MEIKGRGNDIYIISTDAGLEAEIRKHLLGPQHYKEVGFGCDCAVAWAAGTAGRILGRLLGHCYKRRRNRPEVCEGLVLVPSYGRPRLQITRFGSGQSARGLCFQKPKRP